MNFHPLPEFEVASMDATPYEILRLPNVVVHPTPVVTILSFLQQEPYLSPWFTHHIQERVIGQRFLHSPQQWAMPMRLSLEEFIL